MDGKAPVGEASGEVPEELARVELLSLHHKHPIKECPRFVSHQQRVLKGAQVWDFDVSDFNDFLSWSLYRYVGDLRAKIKVFNFLQMGEILAVLF